VFLKSFNSFRDRFFKEVRNEAIFEVLLPSQKECNFSNVSGRFGGSGTGQASLATGQAGLAGAAPYSSVFHLFDLVLRIMLSQIFSDTFLISET